MDLENAEKTLLEEATKATFNLVISQCKSLGLKVKEKIQVNRAVNAYVENYIHRHGQIKVLGMQRPMPLRSIYVNVNVNSPSTLAAYQTIEGIEKSFQEEKKRVNQIRSVKREPGFEITNKEQYLNVLGSPGNGKTTFLKRIGLEALLPKDSKTCKSGFEISQFKHDCLPVLIELKRFKNEEIDIFGIIKNEFSTCNFPESDSFVKEFLEKGKLLILLDGLDEVPNDKVDIIISNIQDFADKYKKNRFITSCRTAFYKTFFRSFVDIEISLFDDDQIKQFVRNWFSTETDKINCTASVFIDVLFNENHQPTLELARTPLLLTFLCLVYDDRFKFPPNRSLLYRRAFVILLERWAAEKRVHNDEIYKDFHTDLEIEMLSEIACEMYGAEKIFFSKDELLFKINNFFENALNIRTKINSSKILEAIEVHQGLLIERANEVYSFSHLTIQEYLTSHYFFSKSLIPKLVNDHFFDPRWREVFLLLAGMSNTDILLNLLTQRLFDFLSKNKDVAEYIKWSQRIIIPNENPEQNLARRLFVLSLPLLFIRNPGWGSVYLNYEEIPLQIANSLKGYQSINYYTKLNRKRAIKLYNALASLTFLDIDRDNSLEEFSRVVDNPLSQYVGSQNKQNRAYLKIILKLMRFDLNYYKPGIKKYEPLLTYLEACELIIQCKEESITITKEAWAKACDKMLAYS
jgi:hypothetical protein